MTRDFGRASIVLDDVLTAVGGIADQSLVSRVDDKIDPLEGELANQYRTSLGHLGDVAVINTILDGQADGAVHSDIHDAGCGLAWANAVGPVEAESLDQAARHRDVRC